MTALGRDRYPTPQRHDPPCRHNLATPDMSHQLRHDVSRTAFPKTTLELTLFRLCEQALNQRLQFVGWQRRDPHETRVQTLQLRFAHCLQVDAGRLNGRSRAL